MSVSTATIAKRLEEILESISDAFVSLDADWHYVYVNKRAGELFGRRPEDLVGKHIWTEFPEGVGQTFYHAYHRAAAEQVFIRLEDYYPPWDRWFENRIYPTAGGLSIFFQDITDRKRAELALEDEAARRLEAEAELRRSEARLRAILDGSSSAIFVKDLEGRYILVNALIEQLMGRDRAELIGRDFENVFGAANEIGRAAEREVASHDAKVTTEEVFELHRGPRTYLVERFPLHGDDGAVSAVGGIATDITERAATEAALRTREGQLAEAQRAAHVGSFEWDMRANRVSWSDELYRIYGLDPQSFGATFETFIERLHPDDRERVAATIEQAVAARAAFRLEERVVRPSGEIRHLSTWGEVVCDDDGAPIRLVGICHDVTELQRQRERGEALRGANVTLTGTLDLDQVLGALLDALVRFVPEIRARILLLDRDEWTVRAARGYDGDEGEDLAATIELGQRCVGCGKTVSSEAGGLAEGAWAVGTRIAVPLRAGGTVIGICEIENAEPHAFAEDDVAWAEALIAQAAAAIQNARLHDELLRHASELEGRVAERTVDLRRAKEEAERANNAKSQFLAGISHELRTPMNAILGFAQLLEYEELTEEQADNVQQIRRAGQHLLELITELLDIARIEAGELTLSLEPVPLQELVGASLDLVRALADERGIAISAETTSLYVLADHQRLLQVVLNLLTNAVKYNHAGGSVEVVCRHADNARVAIDVSDTGPGIAAADVERLFVPFDRLGLEAGTTDGAGLGLALAERLAEAMEGTISVASVPGGGSTFTVVLPEAADPLAALPEAPARDATRSARGATVLYIEDNVANLTLVRRALARQPGIEVVTATDGNTGVELARRHEPDLILLDLHLPDLTGEQVLEELAKHERTSRVPVVVISAAASKARIEVLKRRGIAAYLTKPIDLVELLAVVDDALDGSAA